MHPALMIHFTAGAQITVEPDGVDQLRVHVERDGGYVTFWLRTADAVTLFRELDHALIPFDGETPAA